jgi:hypothetical protein
MSAPCPACFKDGLADPDCRVCKGSGEISEAFARKIHTATGLLLAGLTGGEVDQELWDRTFRKHKGPPNPEALAELLTEDELNALIDGMGE